MFVVNPPAYAKSKSAGDAVTLTIGASGSAAQSACCDGRPFRVLSVCVHSSGAMGEDDMTVSCLSQRGSEWKTVMYRESLGGLTDLLWVPDGDLIFHGGDSVEIYVPGTDGVTVYVTAQWARLEGGL